MPNYSWITRSLAIAMAFAAFTLSHAAPARAALLPPLPAGVGQLVGPLLGDLGVVDIQAPADGGLADRVRDAFAVARSVWGPVCQPTGITVQWATFDTSYADDPNARVWARAWGDRCLVEFSRSVFDDAEWRDYVYDWPWLCTLVVHEYGHLAGRGHSTDPNDIMYPMIHKVYPGCEPSAAPAPTAQATANTTASADAATKRAATKRAAAKRAAAKRAAAKRAAAKRAAVKRAAKRR